jgi:hypothetical protein
MKTADPKKGELWRIRIWSQEGEYSQTALILQTRKDLDADKYGTEVSLFDCLINEQRQTLPIWMFNNAELISFTRV